MTHLTEEVTQLKVDEKLVQELTEKVESLPTQVAEAAKVAAEQAMEDFKKSAEFASLLNDQHRNLVVENIKFYHDWGWLNLKKFKADREMNMADARAEKEEAIARAEREAMGVTEAVEEEHEQAEDDQREELGDEHDSTSTSVPKTPGVSGSENV